MWTCSFKIRVKIEIKEHLSVRLTSQTTEFTAYVAGYVFFGRKCVSFRLYYNPKNFTFPEIYLGMYIKPRQTHNELVLCPPMQDQIRKEKIQKRKISSPHDRILAAGHRISFFPPGLNLTDTLSFATVCKTALLTTCSSNAMK